MKNDDSTDIEQLVERGRHHEALALVAARISKAPERAKFWADQGWILFKMQNYNAAKESFSEALKIHPTASSTLFFRAQCKEKAGDFEGALQDYRASFAIKPRADVLLNIGLILKYSGQKLSAKAAFFDALLMEPTNELALALMRDIDSPGAEPHD